MERFLSNYLTAVAGLQILLYLAAFATGNAALRHWDPRFGWQLIESALMGERFPAVLDWVLGLALLFVGGLMREGRLRLGPYVALECCLAMPSAVVLVIGGTGTLAGATEAHAPTLGQFVSAVPAFVAVSVFPVVCALAFLWRRSAVAERP